jgi:hypothetical protein
MLGEVPTCLLVDCDEPAVMHVRHADVGYRGECFCSWEHLLEYAHAAALGDALSVFSPRAETFLG